MDLIKRSLLISLFVTRLGTAQAVELPDGFVDEAYVAGLQGQITGFDLQAQGRVFISEKSGIVRVFVNQELLDEPFVDLQEIVNDRVDRGLLSVAVHPEFPQSPYVFVLYTYDPPELAAFDLDDDSVGGFDGNGNRVARLVRYTADASRDFNVAIEGSEIVLLGKNSTFDAIGNPEEQFDTQNPSCGPIGNPLEDCLPSDEVTHTIGALRFAADGSLFVTNGDGASYRNFAPLSQMAFDLDSLRGKILRIDPQTGLGLADNPFYDGNPSSNRSRVVSYGLRNPYSMTLHPLTGEPYVGEVGDQTWEEINRGVGKNFGWPCFEGSDSGSLRKPGFEAESYCQAIYNDNEPVAAPLISWEHDGQGNAAIVGDFYFGEVFPEQYNGKLFYGDFIKGWMRYADVSDPGDVTEFDFATDMSPMVEIRSGDDGAIYYASITTGEIRRIRYVDDNATENEEDGVGQGNNLANDDAQPSTQPVTIGQSTTWLTSMLVLMLISRRLFREPEV